MKMTKLISLSILISFFLMALPLPKIFISFRPDLVILVVLYWTVIYPRQFNVVVKCFIGFLLDVFFSYPLGSHAFGLVLLSYILIKFRSRFLMFSIWKQGWHISLLISVQKFILLIFMYFDKNTYEVNSILYGIVVNYVGWVWLRLILDKYLNTAE